MSRFSHYQSSIPFIKKFSHYTCFNPGNALLKISRMKIYKIVSFLIVKPKKYWDILNNFNFILRCGRWVHSLLWFYYILILRLKLVIGILSDQRRDKEKQTYDDKILKHIIHNYSF